MAVSLHPLEFVRYAKSAGATDYPRMASTSFNISGRVIRCDRFGHSRHSRHASVYGSPESGHLANGRVHEYTPGLRRSKLAEAAL
jgi:hypothetical protein